VTYLLHEYAPSGNCYKIRLIAALTGKSLERKHYDILGGETRTPAFLSQINANGRIPVLQHDEQFLPESNAALFYLAQGSAYWPSDAFAQAQVLQWLFWEQYNHEPNIATVRFWVAFVGQAKWTELQHLLYPSKKTQGDAALALMEQHLTGRDWFVGDQPSIADIGLFAYTHVADEGGFDLAPLPHVRAWLSRVQMLPGFVPITA
jgi:glutathione S-transferase